MPETIVEPLRVTVGYSRKTPKEQYGSAEASVHYQVPVDLADDAEAIAAKMTEVFSAAKAAVFGQLGLDFNVDPLTLVATETLKRNLGAVEDFDNGPVGHSANRSDLAAAAPREAFKANPGKPSKEEILAHVAAHPEQYFDNREDKRSPRAPDYKARRNNTFVEEGTAVWVTPFKG
jgi:hypothetical protein